LGLKEKNVNTYLGDSFWGREIPTSMLSLILRIVPSKHAKSTDQELMRTLSIRISFLRVC
jgi:hypothetical protein